jgi:hypothetical protein
VLETPRRWPSLFSPRPSRVTLCTSGHVSLMSITEASAAVRIRVSDKSSAEDLKAYLEAARLVRLRNLDTSSEENGCESSFYGPGPELERRQPSKTLVSLRGSPGGFS